MVRIFEKYVLHCNGNDPFVMLMGNFNRGPISGNNIVSTALLIFRLGIPASEGNQVTSPLARRNFIILLGR